MAIALAVGACGGSQDAPPAPLAMHFDDMYIAKVPLDQKQSVVQTQNDWSLAKMENAKAEADLNDANTQISVARIDAQRAKLDVESKVSLKKAADESADTNRIAKAAHDLHAAESVNKAADQHVKYLEAYQDYLKVVARSAQENMYWREAQYEQAKAQVGQKNGIAPKDVKLDVFPSQEQERRKRAESGKSRVDTAKGRVMTARDTWRKTQDGADKESGVTANHVDPMASSR